MQKQIKTFFFIALCLLQTGQSFAAQDYTVAYTSFAVGTAAIAVTSAHILWHRYHKPKKEPEFRIVMPSPPISIREEKIAAAYTYQLSRPTRLDLSDCTTTDFSEIERNKKRIEMLGAYPATPKNCSLSPCDFYRVVTPLLTPQNESAEKLLESPTTPTPRLFPCSADLPLRHPRPKKPEKKSDEKPKRVFTFDVPRARAVDFPQTQSSPPLRLRKRFNMESILRFQ